MIKDIDEISAYPNKDGSFEVTIHTSSKDIDVNIVHPIITLHRMHLNLEATGGIGNVPTVKMILEGC